MRCEHCGAEAPTSSPLCAPPFEVQPHAFTGNHPADTRAAPALPPVDVEALVERLLRQCPQTDDSDAATMHEAAAELTRLRDIAGELAGAVEPFVALIEKHDARYRQRGGDPDQFPDSHPSFDISAADLPIGYLRRARTTYAKYQQEQGR